MNAEGGRERFRSRMTLPTRAASPRGELGLPDPMGWGFASFVTFRVNARVCPPPTGPGVTVAAYGFVAVFADADVASEAHPARATRRASHMLPERPRRFVDMNPLHPQLAPTGQ